MIDWRRMFALALLMAAVLPADAAEQGSKAQPGTVPPVNLRLDYESRVIGHDGITRDSHYTDIMYRRTGLVWIERELPIGVRESKEHDHEHASPHTGHAHTEALGAPLLIKRDAEAGNVSVQLVLHNLQRVIDVELAHYGNVGYGGSWASAYWLVDPAALSRMEEQGSVVDGIQHYLLRKGEKTTKVAWDVAGQYARSIEQRDNHGISIQRMTATPFADPQRLPWQQLADYQQGDYSDLLD